MICEIDFRKVNRTANNKWECIELMVEAQSKLTDALHIISSMIENNTDDFKESHEKRMIDFVKQFENI